MNNFEGRHVVVTAGASGIGLVIARAFVKHGAIAHVCDIDDSRVREINAEKGRIHGYVADMSRFEEVAGFFRQIGSSTDKLEVLVNNAGVAGPTARVDDIEAAEWEHTIRVNLNGAFFATREAVPMIRANGGGSIVNIASSAAFLRISVQEPICIFQMGAYWFNQNPCYGIGSGKDTCERDLSWQR